MAIASAMFSAMTVLARLSASHASWALVASVRAWMGVLVAVGVARFVGHGLRVENGRVAWGRSLMGTAAMCLSFYTMGAEEIAVGDIATLRATVPILIALLAALFLRERPGRRVYLAVPLAFVGVVVLVQPSFQVSGHLASLTLLGAACSAVAMLFLRRLGPTESPEAVAIHFGVVAGLVTAAVAAADGHPPEMEGLLYVAGTGLAGGLGQLFMTRAYALEKAAAVSAMGYLAVVFTHFGAFFVLGEPLSPERAAGAAMVVLAGLVLVLKPGARRKGAEAAAAEPSFGGLSRRGG